MPKYVNPGRSAPREVLHPRDPLLRCTVDRDPQHPRLIRIQPEIASLQRSPIYRQRCWQPVRKCQVIEARALPCHYAHLKIQVLQGPVNDERETAGHPVSPPGSPPGAAQLAVDLQNR